LSGASGSGAGLDAYPEKALARVWKAWGVGSERDAAAIDVTVTTDSTGFVAQLGDARTLSSKSCDELADAVAREDEAASGAGRRRGVA